MADSSGGARDTVLRSPLRAMVRTGVGRGPRRPDLQAGPAADRDHGAAAVLGADQQAAVTGPPPAVRLLRRIVGEADRPGDPRAQSRFAGARRARVAVSYSVRSRKDRTRASSRQAS